MTSNTVVAPDEATGAPMDLGGILEGLNEAQRAAAAAREGAWLVVAGAGSGKTTVLSRRVAALIASGVAPTSILLLTFTRVAARNMLDRAKRLHPLAVDVHGGTFHSIGHRLAVENHAVLKLPERPSILDPDDVRSAMRRIVVAKGMKDENMPGAGDIAKIHSLAVNMKRDLEDVVFDRFEHHSHAMAFIAECIAEYRKFKRARNVIDYDDLLVAWDRMMDVPALANRIRERFRYVLVDEHQDSNAIQCSIVEKLGGDDPNVMAVGDPAQSIYAFRGSAPRTMFAFIERWPTARVVNLDVNYRSTPRILDIANLVDEAMIERFPRRLVAHDVSRGRIPSFVVVPTLDDEASFIADRILERKADGTELAEQAILVRSMFAARHIEAELVRRRIPYKVMGGIRINDAAHVKDFLSLVRTVVNPLDEQAWERVLTMVKGVGPRKAEEVYRRLSSGVITMPEVVIGTLRTLTKRHEGVASIIEAYEALSSRGLPSELLERALKCLERLFSARYEDWRTRRPDVMAVIGVAEGQESLEAFLLSISLDYSIDKKAAVVGVDDEEAPLTLSTVHSAKGLEWDIVYIPSFVNGHFPSIYTREPEQIEEEKRVLYVAVTRPRRELVIVKPSIGRQSALSPESPFERIVSEGTEPMRVGALHRPASLALGVEDVEIDIFR